MDAARYAPFGARVAALLDFEWARLGPPDLELQPLLASHGDVLRSLIKAYPAIVADAQVVDRLWLYNLSTTLRDLLVKAPLPASDDLPLWHPKRRLPIVLAGLATSRRFSAEPDGRAPISSRNGRKRHDPLAPIRR